MSPTAHPPDAHFPDAHFPDALLQTILTRLAALFLIGADGDPGAARHAAARMLAAYHPRTEDELALAAAIVSFSFQSLEALSQAAAPDTPLTRVLRLRGGAVTLSRESDKARRRLDQLQNARQPARPAEAPSASPRPAPLHSASPQPASSQPASPQPAPTQPAPTQPAPARPAPKIEKALDLIQGTADAAKATGLPWAQTQEKRQQDERIAASLKRAEARVAAFAAAATSGATAIGAATPGATKSHPSPVSAAPTT